MSDQEMKDDPNPPHEQLSEEKTQQQQLQVRNTNRTYKSFASLIFMTINLCLSSFYFGYSLAYFGTFDFNVIKTIFNVEIEDKIAQGLLQGCISVGAGIGALLSFIILKKLSRRKSVLFVSGFALIGNFILYIPSQQFLFLGRLIQGMCVGLYSAIIPLLIKQFSPNEISGTLGALNQLLIAFGVFFAYLFQYILLKFSGYTDHWKLVFGFTTATILIQSFFLITKYNFETPKYLLEHQKEEECRKVLEYIYNEEHVSEVLNMLKADLQSAKSHEGREKIINPRRIFVAIHLSVLQQFVGINLIVSYGSQIVGKILPQYKVLIPVFLNFEQVIASLATTYLLSKFGRKTILQFGTIVSSISLLLISIGLIAQSLSDPIRNFLVISSLVIFMANFGLSLGPIVWLYIPEIVEPQIIPFSTLSNWGSAAFTIIAYPILGKGFFIFFFFWSFMSIFLNQKIIVETKGKSEREIYNEFNRENS